MKNTAEEFIREKIREAQGIKGEMNALWKYIVTGEDCLIWAKEYADYINPKPKKEVKRYFSASYKGFYHNNKPCEGDVHFDCNTYPPRWWIEDKIKELDPGIWKVIVPIINEVSKEDYESFVSKEN